MEVPKSQKNLPVCLAEPIFLQRVDFSPNSGTEQFHLSVPPYHLSNYHYTLEHYLFLPLFNGDLDLHRLLFHSYTVIIYIISCNIIQWFKCRILFTWISTVCSYQLRTRRVQLIFLRRIFLKLKFPPPLTNISIHSQDE